MAKCNQLPFDLTHFPSTGECVIFFKQKLDGLEVAKNIYELWEPLFSEKERSKLACLGHNLPFDKVKIVQEDHTI